MLNTCSTLNTFRDGDEMLQRSSEINHWKLWIYWNCWQILATFPPTPAATTSRAASSLPPGLPSITGEFFIYSLMSLFVIEIKHIPIIGDCDLACQIPAAYISYREDGWSYCECKIWIAIIYIDVLKFMRLLSNVDMPDFGSLCSLKK